MLGLGSLPRPIPFYMQSRVPGSTFKRGRPQGTTPLNQPNQGDPLGACFNAHSPGDSRCHQIDS